MGRHNSRWSLSARINRLLKPGGVLKPWAANILVAELGHSNRTQHFISSTQWPPKSPDTNPLDYCVWSIWIARFAVKKSKVLITSSKRFAGNGPKYRRATFGQGRFHWTFLQDSERATQECLQNEISRFISSSQWLPKSPDTNPLDYFGKQGWH